MSGQIPETSTKSVQMKVAGNKSGLGITTELLIIFLMKTLEWNTKNKLLENNSYPIEITGTSNYIKVVSFIYEGENSKVSGKTLKRP